MMSNILNLPTKEQFDVQNTLLASIASNTGTVISELGRLEGQIADNTADITELNGTVISELGRLEGQIAGNTADITDLSGTVSTIADNAALIDSDKSYTMQWSVKDGYPTLTLTERVI